MKFTYSLLTFGFILLNLPKMTTAHSQSPNNDIAIQEVNVIQDDHLMNTPEDIKIVGDTLFISLRGEATDEDEYNRSESGMTAWDIEDPQTPKLIFKFEHPDLNGAMDHIFIGQTLFLQSLYNGTFLSIDLSDMESPKLLDSLKLGESDTIAYRLFKIEDKDQLIVSIRKEPSTPTGEVAILDISDPSNIRVLDRQTEENTWSYDNFATGDIVYSFPYMKGNKKLHIYQVSQDGMLRFKKSFEHPLLDAVHSFKRGDLLYIANFAPSTLTILNIKDPLNPFIVGELQDERMGELCRIAIDDENGLVWVAGYRKNNISAIDVRNPDNPKFIKAFENNYFDRVQTIAYHKGHLYVGSRDSNSTVILKVITHP